MAALNLFPARVRFVNDDGTLTNEAYRALQIVFGRVGGALGDSGVDVFGQVFGAPTDSADNLSNALSDVVQPVSFGTDFYSDVVQYQASSKDFIGLMLPEVMQPITDPNGVFSTLSVTGNASIGGTLKLAAGTVGLPSLYWSTDTTTGMYRIGANNIGFSVGGTKRLDISATGLAVTGTLSATGTLSGGTSGAGYSFSGSAPINSLVSDAAGIAGIGVVPGTWSSFAGKGIIQIADTGTFIHGGGNGWSGNNFMYLGNNSTHSGGNWLYVRSLAAAKYQQQDGVHTWFTAPVGVAAATITWTARMSLNATGLTVTGTLVSTGALTTPGGATFHTTSTALTNGAGVAAGTLLTAPVAGNPTKWIGINDNGTIRQIPAW